MIPNSITRLVEASSKTIAAVKLVAAAYVVLELAKVREHVVITPARIAQRSPFVIVLALAANVD